MMFDIGVLMLLCGSVVAFLTALVGAALAYPVYAGRAWIVFRSASVIGLLGAVLILIAVLAQLAAERIS